MKKQLTFLPSMLFVGSMTMNAQVLSVQPADVVPTHNDQFYTGSAVSISFDGDVMSVTPASGKGDTQSYVISNDATRLTFSDLEVVPVNLREITGLEYGMTSLVAPETIDLTKLTVSNDLTAYYATEVNSTSVNLTPVGVVGKEQAVMLTGEKGWYCIPVDRSAALSDLPNMFQGSLTESYTVKSDDNIYAFSASTASFRPVAAGVSIPVGKTYLIAPKSLGSVNSLNLAFGALDEETAAQDVKAVTVNDAIRYNMAGQKVGQNAKGIIVSDGVKTLNK